MGDEIATDVSYAAITISVIVLVPVLSLLPSFVKFLWEKMVVMSVSRDQFKDLPLPPGNMGYPFIGESLDFLRKGSDFYKSKLQNCGPIYKTHLLGRPTIRVTGEENVKKILLGENTIVTHNWPTSTRMLLGDTVTQSAGCLHRIRRKSLMQAISAETLSEYIPVIRTIIHEILLKSCETEEILAYPMCKRIAFRVASATIIGLTEDKEDGGMLDLFYDVLGNLMTIPFDIPGFGFYKGMRAKHQLLAKIKHLVEKNKGKKLGYTPIILRYRQGLEKVGADVNDIEEALDLLFAGHETTASGLTNLFMFLGQNNHVTDKLRQELDGHGLLTNDEADISYQELGHLKYVGYVVKELLRLCPPAGGGFRKTLKSFALGGYLIPKDWTVIYSIRETQHTAPIFPDPESFNPDRWETLNEKDIEPGFSYIPFGSGARSCVGKMFAQLVLKLFVIELVRDFDWTLQSEKIQMKYIPIPVSTDHLPIHITRRAAGLRLG